MSSAENDTRPVWLSEADTVRLINVAPWLHHRWLAAPADPAQIAEDALVERYGTSFADGTGRRVAETVLSALGVPRGETLPTTERN